MKTPQKSRNIVRAREASPRRRHIDARTIAEMARLVARMLTESEAARKCGLEPSAWFSFKSRAGQNERWTALLEAYRATRIDSLLDRVEQSAQGKGGVKYPDWRAAAQLLKFTDTGRFGDAPSVQNNVTVQTVDMTGLIAMAERIGRTMIAEHEAESAKQLPQTMTGTKPIALLPEHAPAPKTSNEHTTKP